MNSDSLLELLVRSDDASVATLRMTSLRLHIDKLLESQHYWYLKTQYLLKASLDPRYGSDWATAYSLLKTWMLAGYTDVYGDLLSVQVLLEIGHTLTSGIEPLRVATIRANTAAFSLLLPLVDPTQEENMILVLAASKPERVGILHLLLVDGRCNPAVPGYFASDSYTRRHRLPLAVAVSNGNLDGVTLLLSDDRVDPSSPTILRSVLNIGDVVLRTYILYTLLSDERVNPNLLLERAATVGDAPVLDVLLSNRKVDVTWNNYEYLECAMEHSVECLLYILERTGIDPSIQNNRLTYAAIESNNVPVLTALLDDPRVSPEYYMLLASVSGDSVGTLTVLLQDGRANPTEDIPALLQIKYGRTEDATSSRLQSGGCIPIVPLKSTSIETH